MNSFQTSDGVQGRAAHAAAVVKRLAAVICMGFFFAGLPACGFFKKAETPEARDPALPIQWLEISVGYADGSFLPKGSVLTLTLEDVSRADAPAEFVGETVIEVEGAPPYAASLGYNPKLIQEGHRYALRAEIRHYERRLYTNAGPVDPFEKEASEMKKRPDIVDLPVIRVPRHPEKKKQTQ